MSKYGGKANFGFTVSHTTRQPRPGEVNGVHYHFVTVNDMQQQIQEGDKFLEHATVHGNLYGTSFQSLRDVAEKDGKRCLLDIDVQGVHRVKSLASTHGLHPKYIFIAPPSLEVLLDRLSKRGTETPESLARRTANAKAELEYGMQEGNFDRIVVNDDLEEASRDFARAVEELFGDL